MSSLSDLHAEGVTDLRAYNIGRDDERERIIKLSEDYIPDPHTKDEECEDCSLIRDLVALIKGEPQP